MNSDDLEKLIWFHDWQYKELEYRRHNGHRLSTWSNTVFIAWLAAAATFGSAGFSVNSNSLRLLITIAVIIFTVLIVIWENYNYRAYLRTLGAVVEITEIIRSSISEKNIRKRLYIVDSTSSLHKSLSRTKKIGPVGNNVVTIVLAIIAIASVWTLL